MTSARSIFSIIVIATLALVVYCSMDEISKVFQLVGTAKELFYPSPKPDPATTLAASAKTAPLTGFAAKFSNSLMIMDGGSPRALDTATLAGVKYWAFYYSASWCPPCRAFTPDLVSFYRDFKPSHPDFELIFVNDDRNEDDMLNYMRNDGMPWPAVWYSDIENPELETRKYCGDGIPDLVLVDADGQVISDTYQGGQYTDPHHVIDDIRSMVK